MQRLQSEQPTPKKHGALSNDEKWLSFPRVPHLLGYVTSGNCFGKVKRNGKELCSATGEAGLQTTGRPLLEGKAVANLVVPEWNQLL